MPVPVLAALIVALAMDLGSLVLGVRRALGSRCASGIPLIPLLIYFGLTAWASQDLGLGSPLGAFGLLALFHSVCQYIAPAAVRLARVRRH
jgi:hypothetical protein